MNISYQKSHIETLNTYTNYTCVCVSFTLEGGLLSSLSPAASTVSVPNSRLMHALSGGGEHWGVVAPSKVSPSEWGGRKANCCGRHSREGMNMDAQRLQKLLSCCYKTSCYQNWRIKLMNMVKFVKKKIHLLHLQFSFFMYLWYCYILPEMVNIWCCMKLRSNLYLIDMARYLHINWFDGIIDCRLGLSLCSNVLNYTPIYKEKKPNEFRHKPWSENNRLTKACMLWSKCLGMMGKHY